MLIDSESNIRTQTLDSMMEYVEHISIKCLNKKITPALERLIEDNSVNVKISLAKLIGIMSKLGSEELIENTL